MWPWFVEMILSIGGNMCLMSPKKCLDYLELFCTISYLPWMTWCCYWGTVYLLSNPGNNFATFRYNTQGVLLSENITLVSRRIVFNFVGNILALELWIFVTAFYAFLHTQCVLTIVYFSNPPYLFDFHWETVWDIYLFF